LYIYIYIYILLALEDVVHDLYEPDRISSPVARGIAAALLSLIDTS